MNIDTQRLVIEILESAISNHLTRASFYELCEDEWEIDPILLSVLDNVESYLEHAPIDIVKAKQRPEYSLMLKHLDELKNIG